MARESRFQLVAFDVDGTLVEDVYFVWQTLHDYFGTSRESRDMAFNAYMAGDWSYEQWFRHDIKLMQEKNASRDSIQEAIAGTKLFEGVEETLETLRDAGATLVIISGSLDLVVDKLGLRPFFDEIYLNSFTFDDDGKLSGGIATPYDVWDKATGLRDIAARRKIPMESTAFIGDNFNDVAVAKAAGFSIAYNCKSDELASVADVSVPGGSFPALLDHLLL